MTRLSKCWNHQYFLSCRRKTRRNKPYGNKGQASQAQQKTSHGIPLYGFRNGFPSAHQQAGIKAQTKPERMTLLHGEWYLMSCKEGQATLCVRSCFSSVTKRRAAPAQSTAPQSTQPISTALPAPRGTEGAQHCSWAGGTGGTGPTTAMEGSSSAMLILHGGCWQWKLSSGRQPLSPGSTAGCVVWGSR